MLWQSAELRFWQLFSEAEICAQVASKSSARTKKGVKNSRTDNKNIFLTYTITFFVRKKTTTVKGCFLSIYTISSLLSVPQSPLLPFSPFLLFQYLQRS